MVIEDILKSPQKHATNSDYRNIFDRISHISHGYIAQPYFPMQCNGNIQYPMSVIKTIYKNVCSWLTFILMNVVKCASNQSVLLRAEQCVSHLLRTVEQMHFSHLLGCEKLFQTPEQFSLCSLCLAIWEQWLPKQLDWKTLLREVSKYASKPTPELCREWKRDQPAIQP